MSLEVNDYQCDVSFQENQALSEGLRVWFICASLGHTQAFPRGREALGFVQSLQN